MRWNVFAVDSEDITTRMMFRANHIYILMSGLINLLLSYALRKEDPLKAITVIASTFLVVSTVSLSLSFYIDPVSQIFPRRLTGYSLQALLVGTVIHLLLLRFGNLPPGPSPEERGE